MKTILCIEDDPIIQAFYKNILRENFQSYKILQALTGEEGLNLCVSHLPEIILLDIRLPDFDGLELCQILKGKPETQFIPIVVVSALGDDPSVRVKAIQSGADSFLTKPFNNTEMVEIIRARIRVKQAEEKLKTQNNELEVKYKEISAYQKKLLELNRVLATAEEKERKRISVYLHDQLGATFAYANMKLTTYTPEMSSLRVSQLIEEVSALIGEAIKEFRVAIYDLSPPILYQLGLESAIQWKLDQIEKDGNITSTLIFEPEVKSIDQDFQVFIYRVLSELLLNVLKHAEATQVVVKLLVSDNLLTLLVLDNGKGLNAPDVELGGEKTSLGLHHLMERVQSFGGKLSIKSKPKEFTRIVVLIPLS